VGLKAIILLITLLLALPFTLITDSFSDSKHDLSNKHLNGLTLIWSEEFEEDMINESVWNFNIGDGCEYGLCGWGNNELQYYRRENAFIENGSLVIEARKEVFIDESTGKIYNYTSARLDTVGKFKVQHGYIEVRARLPSGKGLWPAIWMLGEEWSLENTKAWPSCGEIDIMELIGSDPTIIYGTVHAPFCYGGRGVGSSFKLPRNYDFTQDYHVFAIEWTSEYIKWFVDGQLYHVVNKQEFAEKGCTWVFNHSFHIIVNLAVGGYWPGPPDDTTVFPARMYIDYIRVYEAPPVDEYFVFQKDTDNELMARTRGWTTVSFETIVNGDFEEPFNTLNNPLLNPDEWFLIASGSNYIDYNRTGVSNGVFMLALKSTGDSLDDVGFAQYVWLKQNNSYIVKLKAWSSANKTISLKIILPSIPSKTYFEVLINLTTTPQEFVILYNHSSIAGNIVSLTVNTGYNGEIISSIDLYFDYVLLKPWTGEYETITSETSTETTTETTLPTPLSETLETTTSPVIETTRETKIPENTPSPATQDSLLKIILVTILALAASIIIFLMFIRK
jgi:beta-glucanase (GH16 family)